MKFEEYNLIDVRLSSRPNQSSLQSRRKRAVSKPYEVAHLLLVHFDKESIFFVLLYW
ncbi:hypothetical protein RchiOBHm_Chr4g0395661 [Rosa chinensis]|uniref:Uncharacterized protein n=1 Tax=Rosa chinensis TaxID=74649 RepID=A0A2P6QRK0_ROSCH|nr:hypothetical protein RchiOBHm_Chr4g0395661 [Rosa chinensis]